MMTLLLVATQAAGQAVTPQLSRAQREALRRVVAAVETAAGEPETSAATWQTHLLRASDGSHYVAFSVEPPPAAAARGPVLLYVRLATANVSGRGVERSAVGEWLAGKRSDPLLRPRTAIAIGDMPNFGAGAIAARGSTASSGSNDLKLLQLERDRARLEKEERDRQRRAELEGAQPTKLDVLPFEDFDLAASPSTDKGEIQRALTAGPGDYDLYVAWTDPSKPSSAIQVVKRTLHLPPASASELSISSVIVASAVGTRTAPYPPPQQAAHPYAIGLTDITPARTTTLSRDDRVTVAFQVINARASETGKPDIGITFRIVRMSGDREQPVASLTPQEYTAETLPPDFDLRLGHPIFAAMSAPLSTLARGNYRLKIAVNDRAGGRSTTGDVEFSVVGTAASLLAEAPPVALPFRREMALDPTVIETVVERLRPSAPSAALSRALDALRQRRFVELIREEPVESGELGIRTTLTAIALFALGDASSTVQFQRAVQMSTQPGPALFFLGAARALEGRDSDAIAAWQGALERGLPQTLITPLVINAHLRRGDLARASSMMSDVPSTEWMREQVALYIAFGRERDAISVLESRLASTPTDLDAEWLLVHALYASLVRQPDAGLSEKFVRVARPYVTNRRAHATLVEEWLKVIAP